MIRAISEDLRVVGSLIRGRQGYGAESLDDFYRPQAEHYDRFRERLLGGRQTLIERLQPGPGEYWIDFGAGTGYNVELLGNLVNTLNRIDMVDVCRPLLDIARRRSERWPAAHVIRADAATYRPPRPADVAYFSYSLSMMSDWRRAIDNCLEGIRPGGRIGVVDFFVSASTPAAARTCHGLLTRKLWPLWFARDGVRLGPELPDYLLGALREPQLSEHLQPVPYLPGLKVPYFVLTGYRR